ncbi:hypothetical protein GCM10023336_25550 [Streptomyces similanensis]|uniref:ParB/Sulfiredoxin domain-containing protein n=2 Tax=Streptomyces similanensis TaxID=1274988 RepID=A0ABP9KAL0_9ACTN
MARRATSGKQRIGRCPAVSSVPFMPVKKPDVDPYAAVEDLRAALTKAGIVLPSLRVDLASPALRLIELGRVRADVAARLTQALQPGGRE